MIVRRPEMRDTVAEILSKLTNYQFPQEGEIIEILTADEPDTDLSSETETDVKNTMSDKRERPTAASSMMTWLSYLGDLHTQVIDMGLERVGAVADIMNLRYPAPKVITVSGTNGKGTTCHTLESILLAAGLRVGVYSSPHLVNYTERV